MPARDFARRGIVHGERELVRDNGNVAVSAVSFAPIVTVRLADVSPSLHLLNA